jgi:hypothetical protein
MTNVERRELPRAPQLDTRIMEKFRKLDTLPDVASLKPHPIAEQYPMADQHEREGIKASSPEIGILDPIKLYPHIGVLCTLDGRNRLECAFAVNHKFTAADFREFTGTYDEAERYVRYTNSLRRHMSADQKAKHVLAIIDKHPNMPTRKLAKMCGVSHTTIANLRRPPDDSPKYKRLSTAWNGADLADQERFVEEYRTDLRDMLG